MTDTTKQAEFFGKCEAQRQIADYQLGLPMTGTKGKNPYPATSRQWFAYHSGFEDFVNMAFERE